MIDTDKIRRDFPILKRKINGYDLVYLDNAATSQKPEAVVEAISRYYLHHNANVHRGLHRLAQEATSWYEESRAKVAGFIGAKKEEIIFIRNATEGLNLLARVLGQSVLKRNDEVILSSAEHHSNHVPWLMLKERLGIKIRYVNYSRNGILDLKHFQNLLSAKTRIVSLVHISNVLGSVNPVEKVSGIIKNRSIYFIVDGAQSVPRMPVDVVKLGCDFLVFTGHKMLGPTGIGVLWGKTEILKSLPPFLGGGDMIREVSFRGFSVNDLPYKYEAGTPNIAGAIGLAQAIEYLQMLGMNNVYRHEARLTKYALEKLASLKDIRIIGPGSIREKSGIISFNLGNIHPHDIAEYLNREGIAVRSGHHCVMPYHREILGIPASLRASLYLYNTLPEIDLLYTALEKAYKFFK